MAVIVGSTLPYFKPDASRIEVDRARPHAIHLAKAPQLTNLSRHFDEYLDIRRQCVPVVLCDKRGLVM